MASCDDGTPLKELKKDPLKPPDEKPRTLRAYAVNSEAVVDNPKEKKMQNKEATRESSPLKPLCEYDIEDSLSDVEELKVDDDILEHFWDDIPETDRMY